MVQQCHDLENKTVLHKPKKLKESQKFTVKYVITFWKNKSESQNF